MNEQVKFTILIRNDRTDRCRRRRRLVKSICKMYLVNIVIVNWNPHTTYIFAITRVILRSSFTLFVFSKNFLVGIFDQPTSVMEYIKFQFQQWFSFWDSNFKILCFTELFLSSVFYFVCVGQHLSSLI